MLNVFDEYQIEHFHSILRAKCKESDNGDMLCQKAKAIDSMKESSSNFRSTFAVPEHHTAIRGRLAKLKLSAAEFPCNVLQEIKDKPNNASVVTRPKGAKKISNTANVHIYMEMKQYLPKLCHLDFNFVEWNQIQ